VLQSHGFGRKYEKEGEEMKNEKRKRVE